MIRKKERKKEGKQEGKKKTKQKEKKTCKIPIYIIYCKHILKKKKKNINSIPQPCHPLRGAALDARQMPAAGLAQRHHGRHGAFGQLHRLATTGRWAETLSVVGAGGTGGDAFSHWFFSVKASMGRISDCHV